MRLETNRLLDLSLVSIQKSGSYYRVRPSTRLTPASLNLDVLRYQRPTVDYRLTTASLNSGSYTTGNSRPLTRLTTASLKLDNLRNHRRL